MTNVLDKGRILDALQQIWYHTVAYGTKVEALKLSMLMDEIRNHHYDACEKKDDVRVKLDAMLKDAEIISIECASPYHIRLNGFDFGIYIRAKKRIKEEPVIRDPPNYHDRAECCVKCIHRRITHSGNYHCTKYDRVVDWCGRCDTFEMKK